MEILLKDTNENNYEGFSCKNLCARMRWDQESTQSTRGDVS